MYQKDGNSYFIVDGHVHIWDARASNLKNIHGKQFIDCFYDYHRNLSARRRWCGITTPTPITGVSG